MVCKMQRTWATGQSGNPVSKNYTIHPSSRALSLAAFQARARNFGKAILDFSLALFAEEKELATS
jgi:hypothetical protein